MEKVAYFKHILFYYFRKVKKKSKAPKICVKKQNDITNQKLRNESKIISLTFVQQV